MMQNGVNSLSCVVTLCYLYARNRDVIKREMNLEKIDYVFLPKSRKEPYR